ncbi:hypothetical protein, partial [Escherichia coli]
MTNMISYQGLVRTFLNGLKGIGGNVYNGTLGIMSLMAPF